MYDKYTLSRCDAMEWLAENYPLFPGAMPNVKMIAEWCSEGLFMDWKFVILLSGELVFANCISPCIMASDMEGFRLPEVEL